MERSIGRQLNNPCSLEEPSPYHKPDATGSLINQMVREQLRLSAVEDYLQELGA